MTPGPVVPPDPGLLSLVKFSILHLAYCPRYVSAIATLAAGATPLAFDLVDLLADIALLVALKLHPLDLLRLVQLGEIAALPRQGECVPAGDEELRLRLGAVESSEQRPYRFDEAGGTPLGSGVT
jgi:hypothetical protein